MAVPSCAGAYVSGAENSNKCPAGTARIVAEAACRTAAAAAGKTPHPSTFVVIWGGDPRGCYYDGDIAFLNQDAVGAGNSYTHLLCAATTGALFTPSTGARACREARAQGQAACRMRIQTA